MKQKISQKKIKKNIGGALKASEEVRREEELIRPRIEIWLDPADDWAEWVRSHERKKMGNPVDICEMTLGMRGSPLCPVGYH
jgi:hypothetical protein